MGQDAAVSWPFCASEWVLKAEGRANAVFAHVGPEDYIHVRLCALSPTRCQLL